MPSHDCTRSPRRDARPRRARGAWARAVLTIAVVGWLVTGCGDADEPKVDPTPGPVPSETAPAESPTPDDTEPATEVPSGEVWQWAFGQNVWEDPLFAWSEEQHFSPGTTDIYANTLGFSLTPDAQGTVVIVTLFNQGTGMVAYPGQLPGGLDWSMTGAELTAMWGQESLSAIDGLPFYFDAVTNDGYDLDVYVAASHAEDLPTAPVTSIIVRPPS